LLVPPVEEPTPFERRCRMRWAQLIRRVWLEDPLLCPDCGGEMRIISFITDSPVVDRILHHLRRRPGDALLPGILRRCWYGVGSLRQHSSPKLKSEL
jgi:hypothetical protein